MIRWSSSYYGWPRPHYRHESRYLDRFDKNQVRVHLYEDLASDTPRIVRDLCSLLGVPFYDRGFFSPYQKYHADGTPRNSLVKLVGHSRTILAFAAAATPMRVLLPLRDRLVDRSKSKPPLDPKAQGFLRSIYHDDILKLQELIGRDPSGWLE